MRRDPDQNDKQHDCEANNPPHHQLAGTFFRRVRQIINEAQHQPTGFLVARQIVNVLRSHSLPPDCLPSPTVVVMYAARLPSTPSPCGPGLRRAGVERSRATDAASSEGTGTPAAVRASKPSGHEAEARGWPLGVA